MITKINNINNYTKHEINNFRNGKIKIVKSNNDIYKFTQESIKYPSNAKLYFGKIGKDLANTIKKEININLENYNISLQTNAIRHIFKNHGTQNIESMRGQIAITTEDFILIPKIISCYDKIKNTGKTENNNTAIGFQKQFDDIYFLITYISDKNHNLEVKTLWKIKTKKRTLPLLPMPYTPKFDVQNGQRYEFFYINILTENSSYVKFISQKIL